MASNPAHKFGQMIGEVLEATIEPIIGQFALDHELYFDKKGKRPARTGKKVCWTDIYGNIHDLDFVLEKGGTATEIAQPIAFIETAWRRYTKHSRNKAQEIQGAILPLVATHHNAADAIEFIINYKDKDCNHHVIRYEIGIYYNNKDSIQGNFADKVSAIRFLQSYQPPDLRPACTR